MNKIFTFLAVLSFYFVSVAKGAMPDGKFSEKYFLPKSSLSSHLVDIPLYLNATDKRTGVQLKPKYTVTSVKTGSILAVKEEKGQTMVTVKKGESYKIKVEAEGYYPVEKTIDTEDGEDVIAFPLDPQPSAIVSLRVADEGNTPVDADIKVKAGDKTYTGKVSKNNPVYKIILTSSENYIVEVSSPNYQLAIKPLAIEIGDPPKNYSETIRVNKNSVTTKVEEPTPVQIKHITVIDSRTQKPIIATYRIDRPEQDPLTGKTSINQPFDVELTPQRAYKLTVSADNYETVSEPLTFKKDFAGRDINHSVQLQRNLYTFNFRVVDETTRNVILGSKLTIKNATVKSGGDGLFSVNLIPTNSYTLEAEAKGYNKMNQPFKTIDFVISDNFTQDIFLSKTVIEPTILTVIDAEKKTKVSQADVRVYNANHDAINVSKQATNWQAELKNEEDYNVEVSADGYVLYKGNLTKSKSQEIKIQPIAKQQINFTAIDALTKQPIVANYKVIRPEQQPMTGISDEKKSFPVELAPKSTFKLEVSAENCYPYYETISFKNDFTKKDANRVIELSKLTYAFTIKVLDAATKKLVNEAKLTISNITNKTQLTVENNKEGVFLLDLLPASIYSIEADVLGYQKNSKQFDIKPLVIAGKFDQEILVSKNKPEPTTLVLVEEDTKAKIPQTILSKADLKVLNAKNEVVVSDKNPTNWLVELKNDETYIVEVNLAGYLTYKGKLTNEKIQEIPMKLIPLEEITFVAVDFISKTPLNSDFKLFDEKSSIKGTLSEDNSRLKATLNKDKKYDIEVKSKGYFTYKDAVKRQDAVGGIITIPLKKENYTFYFRPVDMLTKQVVPKTQFVCLKENGQEIKAEYKKTTEEYQINLKSDEKYTIALTADNYKRTVYQDLNVLAAIQNANYKQDILMEKKKEEKPLEPVKEKPVITPPKAPEVKPPVIKLPDPKPVTVLEKPTDLGNLEAGKTFRLANIFFIQSTPIIRPESNPQLDELVQTMKQNPNLKIEIIGYTDNVGDSRQNQYLSEFRAKAIASYLFNKGISSERMKSTGKGQENSIAPNDTEENKQKNRRVEFVVLSNSSKK